MDAIVDGGLLKTEALNVFGQSRRDAPKRHDNIPAHIPRLLLCCLPLAIAGFVVAIIVFPSEAQAFGCFAHVSEEITKIPPPLTHTYSTADVTVRSVSIWVRSTHDHAFPNSISARVALPVSFGSAQNFTFPASARRSVFALETVICNDQFLSAIAPAKAGRSGAGFPSDIWGISDDEKPSKANSDQGFFSGHNDGVFMVVSSGERRRQPASLRNSRKTALVWQ